MRVANLVILSVLASFALAGCGGGGGGGGANLSADRKAANDNPNPEVAAGELVRIARAFKQAGDTASAEGAANDAARKAAQIKDEGSKAVAFKDVGGVQAFFNMRTEAKTSLKAATAAAEKIESPDRKGEVLGQVGLIYGNTLKDADQARYWLEEAQKAVSTATDPSAKTRGLIALASYYSRWTADEAKAGAEKLTQAARDAAATVEKPREKADAFGEIAAKLDEMKMADEAKKLYDEATKIARGVPEDFAKAHALCDLVQKMAKRRPAEAQALIDEAEKLAEKISDPSLKTEAVARVSQIRREL